MGLARPLIPPRYALLKRWFPRRYKRVRVLLIILLVLIILRILLPHVLLYMMNKRLANVPGYFGHVEDVEVSLWNGTYVMHHAYLHKLDSVTQEQTPFLDVRRLALSMDLGKLFNGMIVGELVADNPVLKFTENSVEPGQIKKDKNILIALGEDFMPLWLNRVEINHGKVHYIDSTGKAAMDIHIDELYLLAQNLCAESDTAILPSTLIASANVYGGKMLAAIKMNLQKDHYAFDMNAQVREMNLVNLNEIFRTYANIDVSTGSFSLFMEAASRDRNLKGYFKPIIKNLNVLGREDRNDGLSQKLWEGFIGSIGVVLSNQKNGQFATKVPFEGTLKDADIDVWKAIGAIFRNAFGKAFPSSIDGTIDLDAVGNPLSIKGGLKDILKKKEKNKEPQKTSSKAKKKKKPIAHNEGTPNK